MTDTDATVELLSRRHELLRSLRETPRERHELVDFVDASKSTVYKGLSQLTERGLVESTPAGLRPTLLGVVVLERYDELTGALDAGELLATLPADAVDPDALVGAETVAPDGRSIDRHLERAKTMLEGANSIRGFTPAVAPDHVEVLARRIGAGELDATFVLTADVVDHLRENATDLFEELAAAERMTILRTDADLPFTLLIAESAERTEVGIELWDDGVATGLVVNDTDASRRWAESAYERERRAAAAVTD